MPSKALTHKLRSMSTRIDALPHPDRIWTVADLGDELPVQELESYGIIRRVHKQPESGLVEWQTTRDAADIAGRYGIDLVDVGREPLVPDVSVTVTHQSEILRTRPRTRHRSRQVELGER